MILTDMSARRRRDVVNLALGFALQDIASACGTGDLVDMLAVRLETTERELLGRTIVALAPLYPEAQRGAEFKKYGRTMRRWIWSPRGARPVTATEVRERASAHGTALATPKERPPVACLCDDWERAGCRIKCDGKGTIDATDQ